MLDLFVRGIAAGAMAVTGLSFLTQPCQPPRPCWRRRWSASAIIFWLITESLRSGVRSATPDPLVIPAYPVAGLFWLFVLTVFEDRPLT